MSRMRLVLAASVLVAALAVTLGTPTRASAGCAAAVVVDGHVLLGTSDVRAAALPPRGPEREAVSPACNDGGTPVEDGTTSVRPLRGLPPTVAVTDGERLYVAIGSLEVLGDHPLHRAQYGPEDEPTYRDRHPCRREERAMRGALAEDAGGHGFRLRRTDRTVFVALDAATRIVGRPAYQPLREGQRVALRTSICGPRRVADTIRLAGPVPAVERFTGTGDLPGPRWPWVVLAVIAGLVAFVLLAVRAGRRLDER